MTFLNPFLLLGLAAAAIPILVHLFHFRKPKEVEFSSLQLVRGLQQKAMQRLRIRQWLLLALRTLAILGLVVAFARPVVESAWAGVFAGRAPAAIALVIDTSPSMTLRDSQGELLQQAKELAAALAETLQPGDELYLVPTASADLDARAAFTQPGPALDAVGRIESSAGGAPLVHAVARAAALLEDAGQLSREVFVLSDFQATTLGAGGDSLGFGVPDGIRVTLLPLGDRAAPNVAVTDVQVQSQLVEAGRPVHIETELTAFEEDADGYGASVFLEGQRAGQTAADLQAGQAQPVRFVATPDGTGWLAAEIQTEADAAEWDNTRHFVLHVPGARRVLVVEGEAPQTSLVQLALELAAERGNVEMNAIPFSRLAAEDLGRYDAAVLVGPEALSSGEVAALERFVTAGGGVVLFPGEEAGAGAYDALLQSLGGGGTAGMLGRVGSAEPVGRFDRVDLEHPLFEGVLDGSGELESPEVYAALRYRAGSGDEQTVIRLAGGVPFLQEIRHGQGALLYYAVAPDPRWSDFAVRGVFVPLLYRSVLYAAAEAASGESLVAGEVGSVRLVGLESADPVRVVSPDGAEQIPPQRTLPGGVLLELLPETAGVYALYQGDRLIRRVAANVAAAESNLARLSPEEAARRIGAATGAQVRVLDAAGGQGLSAADRVQTGRSGVELSRWFLLLTLAALVAETLVARRWKPEEAGR